MSRFTDAAAAMHTLSLAAMEEASREGIRDADIEHLLLALTLDAGSAGQVLRGLGITLDAARDAVTAERSSQLAALGVQADAPADGRIVFHETNGYEWTDRAVAVLSRASNRNADEPSIAVLRTLVTEPSGTIAALLHRLGIEPAEVEDRLDVTDGIRRPQPTRADGPRGTLSAFVPAPPADVWALVSDAHRIPDWDSVVGTVTPAAEGAQEWDAAAPTTTREGKPLRIREDLRRIRIRLEQADAPHSVTWRMTYPDARAANDRVVRFALEHAAGGTQVRIDAGWERAGGRRSLLGWMLRPLARLSLFFQLAQISSGLSRAFR